MRTSVFITLSCVLSAAAFTPAPVRPCVSHKPFRLSAQEALPGFSTAFSENGLDYFTKVGSESLSQKSKNLTIPSISGIASVTIVGDIQYNITQSDLGELDFSNSQLDIVPGVGLSVTVKRALSSGSFNWHWEEQSWPHIHGTGTADFTFVLSLNMQLAFSAVDDHLHLKTVSPTVSVDDLEISTSGINSWFYNLLIDVLSPLIQNTISTQLTNAIQNVAQTKINEISKQVPIRQSIKTPLVFDIGLTRDPEFDSSSFRLYESGASYDSLNPTECPKDVCPQRILPNTITQRMAQVYVSDYVANSMGYAAYQSGFIHVEVTPDMVPSTSILKLNTNSLNGILPKLAATYPNASVYLDIVGTRAPAVTFNSTTEATFTVYLQIEISVGVKNEKIKAITIEGDISGSATVRTNNSIVYPAIGRAATFNWNVTQSSIGDFNSKPSFGATKSAYSTVTNVVNNKFKEGISLPTVEGLEFVNPTSTWSDGFFSVEVDFVYHPPTS